MLRARSGSNSISPACGIAFAVASRPTMLATVPVNL